MAVNLDALSQEILDVLLALLAPDPAPPCAVDSTVKAMRRRLPKYSEAELERALQALNGLGLTRIPFLHSNMKPAVTAHPERWLTEKGWEALEAIANRGLSSVT